MALNPLRRNDPVPGTYPPSWYAASAEAHPAREPLRGSVTADAAVVGAGYTGLWAARVLAEAGLRVVVLEAHRAGWGASGRNGGQVQGGFNRGQRWLEARMGHEAARAAWNLAEEGRAMVRAFCEAEAPEVQFRPGVAHGAYALSEVREQREEAEHLAVAYGYDRIEVLEGEAFRALVKARLYKGGALDRGAGHLHPLRYALALARAAEGAGAVIHEGTEVLSVEGDAPVVLRTPGGEVRAGHVILAGNGYMPDLDRHVAARVMPINSFIGATEPRGNRWTEVLAEDIAVSDSRFVVNYFRFSEDRRFLFGGRESFGLTFPRDIAGPLRHRMLGLFPQLGDARIEHVWGGTLGITMTRLPLVLRVAPSVLSGGGFSGHGVALSAVAGRAMAEAVIGRTARLDTFAQLPTAPFPGGARFRSPLLTLAMTWYGLRDRIGT